MQVTDVSCAIIVREGMILAAKRNDSVSHSGQWEFPGGRPMDGEAPQECVVRRVREELNVEVEVADRIVPYEVAVGNEKQYRIFPFVARIVDGSFELSHHSKAEWFMPMQLMSLAWPDTDLPIIDEIVGRIFRNGRIV